MYENKTYESILQRALAEVPTEIDKREGSIIYNAIAPICIELAQAYIDMDIILDETYADTASREYLIRRCAERGIVPKPASAAFVKGIFNTEVPIGSRFTIDGFYYIVKTKISDTIYQLECESAGSLANGVTGTLLPVTYIEDLKTAKITEVFVPGEEEEETEHLRNRYFASLISQAFGGNKADYKEKVERISGVGGVKVKCVWNGDIKPVEMIPTKEVIHWYQEIIDTLKGAVKEWLLKVFTAAIEKKLTTGGTVSLTIINSEYRAASNTLLETVQQIIDPPEYAGEGYGVAPIGHVVTIKTVQELPISFSFDLTYQAGYDFESCSSSIYEAIDTYLNELNKGWAENETIIIRISKIESRMLDVMGIIDITNTMLNGKAQNLVLNSDEIAIRGEVYG